MNPATPVISHVFGEVCNSAWTLEMFTADGCYESTPCLGSFFDAAGKPGRRMGTTPSRENAASELFSAER
jgi:hypothetical protein